jgi:glycosyltransferase involved in cell wall biosynthesis
LLEELQALARELKIDNRVSFPGFVSQSRLSELFYASHFFLHPSETGRDGNQEGVPNSMLEAMASGLPVFATNHGGIPEAIENEISGMLVAERDHAALAQALLNAAQDRHLIAQLGRLGSQAVGEKFDQRTQVRKLEDIYLKTIAG